VKQTAETAAASATQALTKASTPVQWSQLVGAEPDVTSFPNESPDPMLTKSQIDAAIGSAVSEGLTEQQFQELFDAALLQAENTGGVATEEWVEQQLQGSQVPANVVTAEGSYLYVNGVRMENLNVPNAVVVENSLEVANTATIDGTITDVNGSPYVTQAALDAQTFLKKVTTDAITITGDGTPTNPLKAGATNVQSITTAELSAGILAGTLTPGTIVYVTDGTNQYTGQTGVYTIIKADGTPDAFVLESEFEAHRQTDLTRWQQVADMQTQIDTLAAQLQNKTTAGQTPVDILSYAKTDAGYTIESNMGGVIDYTLVSVLVSAGAIYVNGVKKISGDGLDLSIGGTNGTFVVNNGDVITCSSLGVSKLTFTPYVPA
jgi:hypothetical protein